jgi:hypothetical protein
MKPRQEEKFLLSFKQKRNILPRRVPHKEVIFVGTQTIAFNQAFGSFTLLELVSYQVNWFLW